MACDHRLDLQRYCQERRLGKDWLHPAIPNGSETLAVLTPKFTILRTCTQNNHRQSATKNPQGPFGPWMAVFRDGTMALHHGFAPCLWYLGISQLILWPQRCFPSLVHSQSHIFVRSFVLSFYPKNPLIICMCIYIYTHICIHCIWTYISNIHIDALYFCSLCMAKIARNEST